MTDYIPDWLKKILSEKESLVEKILDTEDLPYEVRDQLMDYYKSDYVVVPITARKLKNFFQKNKGNTVPVYYLEGILYNCVDFVELFPEYKEFFENNQKTWSTVIRYYAKFGKKLPEEFEQTVKNASDGRIIAAYIEYNPQFQYELPTEMFSHIVNYVKKDVLDAMYWWNQLKEETGLYYEPRQWIVTFSRYRETLRNALSERWDVPWAYVFGRKKFIKYYLSYILKNPFLPETYLLVYKNDLKSSDFEEVVEKRQLPLNQRARELQKWELKSLETFFNTIIIPAIQKNNYTLQYLGRFNTKKEQIIQLYEQGMAIKDIAKKVGTTYQVVYSYVKKYKETIGKP